MQDASARPQCEPTWTAPPPSESYKLCETFAKVGVDGVRPPPANQRIPKDLMDELGKWKEKLQEYDAESKAKAAEEARRAALPHDGPEPPEGPYQVVVTEAGTGKTQPKPGDTVRIGCMVVLDDEDATMLACEPDFEYVVGCGADRGAGQVKPKALDAALVQMRRGANASVRTLLPNLFPADAPVIKEHGHEARAVCEVKLMEIFNIKDCSFEKGSRQVLKEVVKDGVGDWCDNPTDEGSATLRIEEVTCDDGTKLFPIEAQDGRGPLEVRVVPGNGEVCDALECAMLQMRWHEVALVRCPDVKPSLLVGGAPLFTDISPPEGGATLRVELLEYNKGPDVWSFDEEDRVQFALRRKEVASRLFKEGRFRLARERYSSIVELFHHLDKYKVKDRFLGKPEVREQCKELRNTCRLNIALCSLRLNDARRAKTECDAVLRSESENIKALYRRAQAHFMNEDFVQACRDLVRLREVDGGLPEANALLRQAAAKRKDSDRKQMEGFKFGKSMRGLEDLRSIKNDYMDCPVDMPGVEGVPVRNRRMVDLYKNSL
eukprot:gnl/TRDRNA2_/TRDRNA2_92205_c0_seq1.p1 gnl/TRDRNA2_/TRDRNA2_92205_c0~~gnl/TRDRNA2_/TRDRNA2_92205_c0_seq1.p1  ORF type:complete len:599 (-),score=140.33 gnl/TRDRNA2_/TRDRNA2_92205_c0_seq1:104-1747(-)